jgi:hypothetical protein
MTAVYLFYMENGLMNPSYRYTQSFSGTNLKVLRKSLLKHRHKPGIRRTVSAGPGRG